METLYLYIDYGLIFLRLAIGASFLVHGIQKLRMWKMRPDEQISKSMININRLLSIVEPLGAIALMIGFLTQYAALGLMIIMLGAIYIKIKVWRKKFSEKGGWEMDLIILAGLSVLFLVGAGYYSLDIYILIRQLGA
ncbi:MAG: DoxX family protein [Candidatus Paceibacterota bacterium]